MRLKKDQSEKSRLFQREIPQSRYIPISHFNSPTLFETKNSDQGCVIKLDGFACALMDASDANQYQRFFANWLVGLNEEFACYVTMIRQKHQDYPKNHYSSGFAQDFHDAYEAKLQQKQLYRNEIYLTVLIKNASNKLNTGFRLMQKMSHAAVQQAMAMYREKQKTKLEKMIQNALVQLQPFRPRLLTGNANYSESLAFYAYLVNGHSQRCRMPLQDIASYLPQRRICLGHQTIQWVNNTSEGEQNNKFAALVSIKHYCPDSNPFLLRPLQSLDVEFIQTQCFLPIPHSTALQLIRKQHKHLIAVQDAALSQQEELVLAEDLLASNRLGFGYHHNTVLVLASCQSSLEEKAAQVIKCYRDADIVAVRETLNLESAFWAQLPGNFSAITRGSLISTDNFADFCALHNEPTGYRDQNHLGSVLLLVETPHRTPLYLNFHERSQGKHDISKGHTTIIAPSNAGKTTLMNALDLGAKQYQGTSVFFDRDRGCEIYIRALAGQYLRIHPSQATGFNPLQIADTPANRDFLMIWLKALIESSGKSLDAIEMRIIEQVVHRNYTLPMTKRRLSLILSFFPHQFAKEHLQPWIAANQGRLAYLFDHPNDELTFQSHVIGFDMTHLLDHESQAVIFPVMLYLFHRIEQLFDGNLVGIMLDEGWQYLNNTYWKEKLRAYLPSLRKKNVYMVFATQSPGTVAQSTLKNELISGSATNIFFPNPKAEADDYCDAFKLSSSEYRFIKETPIQSRLFLFKQGNESAIGRLDLTGLEQYTSVLAANQKTLNILDQLIAKVGDDPACWLPLFYEEVRC